MDALHAATDLMGAAGPWLVGAAAVVVFGVGQRTRARRLLQKLRACERELEQIRLEEQDAREQERLLRTECDELLRGQQVESARARRRNVDLARIFEISRKLNRQQDLREALESIVGSVRRSHHFAGVLLRVYNPRTRLFEARAFAGLDGDAIGRISNRDITMDEFAAMARRAERVGHSYRIAATDPHWPDRFDDASSTRDVLLIPLLGDEGGPMGYICASTAPGGELPDEEAVRLLELFAVQAVTTIQGARLRSQLQRKDLELSLASEKLKELGRLKENFVATVSHELRTPLTSVRAYAETLGRSLGEMDPGTVREFVDVILDESQRLEQVFDDILDVSLLENGENRMLRDPIGLRSLIGDLTAELRPEFDAKDIEFLLSVPESEEVVVQGDRGSLEQVIRNLLGNALKFTPRGGQVRVRLRQEVSTVQLAVEDTGVGIPEEELGRIFDRFYQVDSSSTRSFGGQGLGLAISRDIVRWHHGRIWAERVAPSGSRFVVVLPRKGLVVHQRAEGGADPSERLQWETFLHLATGLLAEVMGTRVASIMLADEASDSLTIEAAVGLEEEIVQSTRVRRGEGIAGHVWAEECSILVPDLDADPRFAGRQNDLHYPTRSLLSAPLLSGGRVSGVLNVNNKIDGSAFDEWDRLLLEALAERLARAFLGFAAYRRGHRRLAAAQAGMRAVLQLGRDRRTPLRERIARLGLQTAQELGLPDQDLRNLAYVLRSYDLGLTQVGEQILRKVSPLTPDERGRIEDHVRTGAELCSELEPVRQVRKIILHHHENADGSGYPDGLRGEAIPVGARICRLVDATSALLHDRPFRSAMGLDDAVALLREGIGRRFCGRVGPVYVQVLERYRHELQELLTTGRAPNESIPLETGPAGAMELDPQELSLSRQPQEQA